MIKLHNFFLDMTRVEKIDLEIFEFRNPSIGFAKFMPEQLFRNTTAIFADFGGFIKSI